MICCVSTVALVAGCSSSASTKTSTDAGSTLYGTVIDAGLYQLTILAPAQPSGSCDVHAEQPSTFTDVTDAWGLGDGGLMITGDILMTADLDSDGYPDIIISSANNLAQEPAPSSDIRGWSNLPDGGYERWQTVLMNRPNPAGGRMFVEATLASGLFALQDGGTSALRSVQLVSVGDVNNDGTLDAFTGTYHDGNNVPPASPADRSAIMLNDGRGHFSFAPASDPTTGEQDDWATSGATFADVDHDGNLDLYVGHWYDNYGFTYQSEEAHLYKGHGEGTFTDITQAAGVQTDSTGSQASLIEGTGSRPSYGVTACDLNDDGYPELMVTAYGRQWNILWQNDGSGSGAFNQISQDGGYPADTNLDYYDNQDFVCYCTLHTSDPGCENNVSPLIECPAPADSDWDPVDDEATFRLNGNGFTTICRDFNGDGLADIYTANIRHWYVGQSSDPSQLLINASPRDGGAISFERLPNDGDGGTGLVVSHYGNEAWDEGLVRGTSADLDNDGRPDLIVAASDYEYNYGLFYIQQPDGTFQNMAIPWGLEFPCLNGISVADFNRDGDLDVLAGAGTARDCSESPTTDPGGGGWAAQYVHLFQNNAHEHSNWLELRLRGDGVTANKLGLGAKVTVTANGVSQVQEMTSNFGTGAQGNDVGVLFFGMGACSSIDSIEVRWPNRALTTESWTNVPGDKLIELHQGDPNIYGVVLPN